MTTRHDRSPGLTGPSLKALVASLLLSVPACENETTAPAAEGSTPGTPVDASWTLAFNGHRPSATGRVPSGNVYIASDEGSIQRFDGTTTEVVDLPKLGIWSLWGSSDDDLYAIGRGRKSFGRIRHFDGTSWTTVDDSWASLDETLDGWTEVHGSSASHVVVGSLQGLVATYDGVAWRVDDPGHPLISAILARAPDDVFVGTEFGRILHYDGAAWTEQARVFGGANVSNLFESDGEIYASSSSGRLAHHDGTEWVDLGGFAGVSVVVSVGTQSFGLRRSMLYPVSPSGWGKPLELPLPEITTTVWGNALDDMFALSTTDGTAAAVVEIARYDGTGWTLIHSAPLLTLTDAWTDGTEIVAVGSDDRLLRGSVDGAAWSISRIDVVDDRTWFRSYVEWPSGDAMAVGRWGTIVFRPAGGVWKRMSSHVTQTLNAIWGPTPDNVTAVGEDGAAVRYEGSEWRTIDLGTVDSMHGIWGTGPEHMIIVGYAGAAIHYDGSTWSPRLGIDGEYGHAVWGIDPERAWAVFGHNVVEYRSGRWTTVHVEPDVFFHAITGHSPDDILILGWSGSPAVPEIRHFDGRSWATVEPVFPRHGLLDAVPLDDGRYAVVGAGASILELAIDR